MWKKIKRFVDKCPYCKSEYAKTKKQKKSIFDEIVEQTVRDIAYERTINKKHKKEKKQCFLMLKPCLWVLTLMMKHIRWQLWTKCMMKRSNPMSPEPFEIDISLEG